MSKENLFICAVCQETYTMARPDAEAMDEFRRDFPTVDPKHARAVCEDCYQLIRAREAEWHRKNSKSDA